MSKNFFRQITHYSVRYNIYRIVDKTGVEYYQAEPQQEGVTRTAESLPELYDQLRNDARFVKSLTGNIK